jgi:hypothetical protein
MFLEVVLFNYKLTSKRELGIMQIFLRERQSSWETFQPVMVVPFVKLALASLDRFQQIGGNGSYVETPPQGNISCKGNMHRTVGLGLSPIWIK